MGNSTLPTVLDKLCMVANINTRKLIELKKEEIKIKEIKIEALQEMIDSLEEKMNDQARRLDALTLNEKLSQQTIQNCSGNRSRNIYTSLLTIKVCCLYRVLTQEQE
jgi:hypothetical protein